MIFETGVIIGFGCLLVLVAIQASQISKLNRLKDVCFKQLNQKIDRWKYESLETKIERLEERNEYLLKEIKSAEEKAWQYSVDAKNELRGDNNKLHDQLHAFADKLGYSIDNKPSHFQVSVKVR